VIEGLRVGYCNEIQNGNVLIGVEKDMDNIFYLKIKEG